MLDFAYLLQLGMLTFSFFFEKRSFLYENDDETIVFSKSSFFKMVVFKTIASLKIVNDYPSLTIVNDYPSLTIVNDNPSSTIVKVEMKPT